MHLRIRAEQIVVETFSVVLGILLALAATHTASAPGGLQAVHGWDGVHPVRVVDDAWRTAGTTGAMQYIPFAVVLPLSKTYELQQRVVDLQRAFYSVVYTPQFAVGGVAAIASMSSFLGDLVANERQLVKQYDLALRDTSATR
jgi:hypothetical protein